GAADARRRARRRTFVLQVPDNKADAVPCERLHSFYRRFQNAPSLQLQSRARPEILDENTL
ncbi:MAG: hypothetical protein ABF303_11640, partial [Desulfobacterales bacterium]